MIGPGQILIPILTTVISNHPRDHPPPERPQLPSIFHRSYAHAGPPFLFLRFTRTDEYEHHGEAEVPQEQHIAEHEYVEGGHRVQYSESHGQHLDHQLRIQEQVSMWDAPSGEHPVRPPMGRERLWEILKPFKPSEQIYVMGLNRVGRYITHALAGCQTIPPPRYILHEQHLREQWELSHRRIVLHRGPETIIRDRIIAENTWRGVRQRRDPIENLVVTVPAGQVLQALKTIRHRLDHRSTILLINDGLGVAEDLINAYFPDELTRPIFLLGYSSTALAHTDHLYSVAEVHPGRLYLTLWQQPPDPNLPFRLRRHPPLERTVRGTHFLRLLTAMPGLSAGGFPLSSFYKHKLPATAFRAIVDPLAAMLDCNYEKLAQNRSALALMDRLIGEVASVIARLPECTDRERQARQVTGIASSLRKEVLLKLRLMRSADSPMRSRLSRGYDTDLDYTVGYFVRRGRELRVDVSGLEAVMFAAKAKLVETKKEREDEVPLVLPLPE
ncbi:2-dehydropantoate 2-reductase-like protein [Thermochaetoides thermophila DSM 1495]|uniref:2-dehydropantoate 2-reductase-like protein n=1 Tax=Chaetomium thermophilum (strain DSM 1495 / CBS 144.50 / IMI 039719) TaxID=759272 RepID=G0S1C5_CHATD|nr:2-dehydropantoate 2-reductase-like protein [Thermochaetoides thermophila DSM 1495]EGS22835.1 2-dehydropantoate 2-reductase-like protein [Thermochaetoides thermophila DSM 1495]